MARNRAADIGKPRRPAPGKSVVVAVLALTAAAPAIAEWYVVCDTGSGEVVVSQDVDEAAQVVMTGPLPGPRMAALWLDDLCPERRCTSDGLCLRANVAADEIQEPQKNAWVAGELSTVTVGKAERKAPAPVLRAPSGPLSGPGRADLTPLIETAKAAAAACRYPAALAAADHMTNFDPGHPWLKANQDTLRRLADRQKVTEQAVWRASAQLQAGRFEEAHELAMQAADTAVSCQSQAVSNLVTGIDTAIQQRRMERRAARQRVAASLLPGLLDLARIASGGHAAPADTAAAVGNMVQSAGAGAVGIDPCAFRIEYTDPQGLTPACTCPGYFFDLGQFRCLPGGG